MDNRKHNDNSKISTLSEAAGSGNETAEMKRTESEEDTSAVLQENAETSKENANLQVATAILQSDDSNVIKNAKMHVKSVESAVLQLDDEVNSKKQVIKSVERVILQSGNEIKSKMQVKSDESANLQSDGEVNLKKQVIKSVERAIFQSGDESKMQVKSDGSTNLQSNDDVNSKIQVKNAKKTILQTENEVSFAKNKVTIKTSENPKVLFIEPFYGGSHKQLIDTLLPHIPHTFIGLPAKKWPWRARCSALILSERIPQLTTETVLFCSCVLSLAELLGLRSDLNRLRKIVYFHENQLVYPIRDIKARDVQFAYNQITTSLAADLILFNSEYNRSTFLSNIPKVVKLLPDLRPRNLQGKIADKTRVLYFPVNLPPKVWKPVQAPLKIVWPHRWEFDKDPETFLQTLVELKNEGFDFRVHIIGECFSDVPDIFPRAKAALGDFVLSYGYVSDKEKYYDILRSCHVAVSTAKHEFFGVSMMEAVYLGCLALVPNDLVYPEFYAEQHLYEGKNGLKSKLAHYCVNPKEAIDDMSLISHDLTIDEKFSAEILLPEYLKLFV